MLSRGDGARARWIVHEQEPVLGTVSNEDATSTKTSRCICTSSFLSILHARKCVNTKNE